MRSKRFHLLSSCLCSLEMDQERLSFLYLQDLNKDCSLRRLRIEFLLDFRWDRVSVHSMRFLLPLFA